MKSQPALTIGLILSAFAAPMVAQISDADAAASAYVDASSPALKKDDGTFLRRHAEILARAKAGPIGLLFLGDSITAHWADAPHIWEAYFGKYQPANFGVAGDATQHVIWRIEHGELSGIHPRVVVLLAGTNNTATHSAAEITAADKRIVELIRKNIPEAKVLLLGIFPRGVRKLRDGSIDTGAEKMKIIRAVNSELAQLDDGETIRYLDIGEKFLGQDGKIPFAIMPEQLHPNAAGYQLWADAMKPLLDRMMGEPATGSSRGADLPH